MDNNQTVRLVALRLQRHNHYREKHHDGFSKKYGELHLALKQPDVDLQEVTRLVEEMMGLHREIHIDSKFAIKNAIKGLIPSDEWSSLDNTAARSASEQYSKWECNKKKSVPEDSIPTSSSSPALSTSKEEDEVTPSIASEEDENLQPRAESTSCSTDEREEKESTDVVKVPDNQEGEKTEGRWRNVWRRCTAGIIPPSALSVDGKEESTSDCLTTEVEDSSSNNFDLAESQETDIATDDKPDDSFDTAATVSVASEDLLPTSKSTTAPPVVNSVSEDPTVDIGAAATTEAAVESAAVSEDVEASSAAATEAAAAKPTAARDLEDLAVDISAFDSLINSSGDNLFAGTKLPILRLVQEIIGLSFKSEKDLHTNIENLALDFVSVLTMLPILSENFGAFLRQESAKDLSDLEGVPLSDGFGSIMSSCEKKTSETEDDDQSYAVPDKVIEIKKSILYAENGYNDDTIKQTIFRRRHGDTTAVSREAIDEEVTDEDVKSFINDEVTNTSVKKHLMMGRQTNSLLMHLLNLYFAAYFLSELSIRQLFEHFTEQKQATLIAKLSEFAQRANPEVPFDEDMKAILYLVTFVAPSLRKKELRKAAWEVACTVFNYLNKIECTGSRDTAETKANDPRKKYFLHLARTFECQTANGATDDTAVVFWSDNSKKRLSAFRMFAVLFLREAIEGSLDPGFFSELGFTRCFLRLPPSGISEWTTFVTPKFFSDKRKYSTKFDDIIKKAKKKAGEDTGERTLFIQGDEQRKSLKALRKMFVVLSSSGPSIEV